MKKNESCKIFNILWTWQKYHYNMLYISYLFICVFASRLSLSQTEPASSLCVASPQILQLNLERKDFLLSIILSDSSYQKVTHKLIQLPLRSISPLLQQNFEGEEGAGGAGNSGRHILFAWGRFTTSSSLTLPVKFLNASKGSTGAAQRGLFFFYKGRASKLLTTFSMSSIDSTSLQIHQHRKANFTLPNSTNKVISSSNCFCI